MNELIADILFPLGITSNYTGFHYVVHAVELAAADPSHLVLVTKDLYPTVASHFSSTASRVERNLRHIADLAWKTNPQLLQSMAGHSLQQRPCVSQFVAILTMQYQKLLAREDSNGQQRLF